MKSKRHKGQLPSKNAHLTFSENGSKLEVNDNLEKLVADFASTVDTKNFYSLAEQILAQVDDIRILITSANLARQRMPGGTYFSARLWARVIELLYEGDEKQLRSRIRHECENIGIAFSSVKGQFIDGQLIKSVAEKLPELDVFREVSPQVFENARRHKQQGTEYLLEAAQVLRSNPKATSKEIHQHWCRKNGSIKSKLDIIKPSDWWAFSHPKWRQEKDFPGSIPGEVYANALYYFAPVRGVAVDPMAGSGMFKRVYDDRERWQKDLNFDLEIHLFDLFPKRDFIQRHDARDPLPLDRKADWIFLDPPYFGQSTHLYEGILATTRDYLEYLDTLSQIIQAMYYSLAKEGRLCIFLPKWSGTKFKDPNRDTPGDVYRIAVSLGLKWIDTAYVSRGRQQEGGSAIKNNTAKRQRRMRSDTCVLNVFEK